MSRLTRLVVAALGLSMVAIVAGLLYGVLVRPPSLAVGWAILGIAWAFLVIGGVLWLIQRLSRLRDRATRE